MPRLHFVKKALKDNPVAKKGESYYWFKPMVGGRGGMKRYFKERPSRSQMTQSEYFGTAYDLADSHWPGVNDQSSLDEFKSAVEELRDNEQEKYDNMPEGLQQGSSGETIQERIDECETLISELDSVEFPDEPEDRDAELPEDHEAHGEYDTYGEWFDAKVEEAKEGVDIPW